MTYSLEKHYEIWDDGNGEKIGIGPDRDGLDLIEIRNYIGGKVISSVTFNMDQLILLLKVLLEIIPQNKIIK